MGKSNVGTVGGRVLIALALMSGVASATEPNYVGSASLGIRGVSASGQLWAEITMSEGANKPTSENTFGATAVMLEHTYFRLTATEAAELAAGLDAWVAEHHSYTVYEKNDGAIGITFVGNAWSQEHSPVVIVNIQAWIQQERGHIHGGNYVALSESQAGAMAAALSAWAANPTETSRGPFFTLAF